jgi:hypothetical protein
MEQSEMIIILDEGSEETGIVDPETACCVGAFTWIRH